MNKNSFDNRLGIIAGIFFLLFFVLFLFGKDIHWFNDILNKKEYYSIDPGIGQGIFFSLRDFLTYHILVIGGTLSATWLCFFGYKTFKKS